MQDHKSLCAAVMLCAIVVNTQTHRQMDFDWLYMISPTPAELKSFLNAALKFVQTAHTMLTSHDINTQAYIRDSI